MSITNHDPTTRKPSGSSTQSGSHSPSGSPGHAPGQRKVTPAGNFFGVGMGNANGLKSLNSGWQTTHGYRAGLEDTWSTNRSVSSGWEEVNGSPQRKDLPQMDAHAMNLHPHRQRPANSASTTGLGASSGSLSKNGQFSPQRYDGTSRDASSPSRYPASSPTRPTYGAVSSYGAASAQNGVYDTTQVSTLVDNELTSALRGMAVEDDYTLQGYRQSQASAATGHGPHVRAMAPTQTSRAPFTGFPQPDFSAYYAGASYAYDAYRATSDGGLYAGSPALATAAAPGIYPGMTAQPLHPHAVADVHGQASGVFYEYPGSARPGSQFFYPTQPIMFHTPPSMPSVPAAHGTMVPDKKRDLQISAQNVMYGNVRSSPSPHLPSYSMVEFATQLPIVVPGSVYGPGVSPTSPHPLQHPHHGHRIRRAHDANSTLRSQLLDEFRANRTRGWELKDIFGYVVEFSGDQHGSRFIQQKLETATTDEKQRVFDEVVPQHALPLIQDVFGNYVIQKLFEHGTSHQRSQLATCMDGHILTLSLQMYGCRVVQKAVEYITPEQQSSFVKELDGSVLRCVKDANGNHVIQKLIERVAPERLGFVTAFRGSVYELSTHPYGCRVLQRCLEYLPEDQTRPLLDELHKYAINLMQDQYGNYVIQFVLEHGKPEDGALIVSKLRGQMLNMARHKFASNVCEKALVTTTSEMRRSLIDEIMTPKEGGVSPVVTMMKDQFANYVLQRALSVVEGEQKPTLISIIKPQLVNMRRYSSAYSKHLVAIERLLEKCGSSANGDNVSTGDANAPPASTTSAP
ncbi:hypothetical protein NLI96_g2381 [Meripilus lineatus]|uniref:Pumilio homology domain family member 3 n=1 Tax=Meripilus lineatus TaxID=2056292 RepID=A0AAD5YHI5_9APHY|nr:hypothetical protein NLI96_g2381 [Physisporinus lineatus]